MPQRDELSASGARSDTKGNQMLYTVTVRTLHEVLTFPATGTDAAAVHMAALEQFGACGVTVRPS